MKEATKRTIVRSVHLVLSIPILGYIYSPYDQLPLYASRVRLIFVPLMVLTGLWMWKGHVLVRAVKRLLKQDEPSKLAA